MRNAARQPTASTPSAAAVPTIVFHGRSDRTVHPDNGRRVIEEAAARAAAAGIALQREEQRLTVVGRTVTRTVYNDPHQVRQLEHWEATGAVTAPHTTSGTTAPLVLHRRAASHTHNNYDVNDSPGLNSTARYGHRANFDVGDTLGWFGTEAA